jgi:class 3 adenylate cyclase
MPVIGERAVRDRAYVAVLFTDIVGSTAHLVEAGDERWQDILDAHDRLAQRCVRAHHGRVVKSTGDGILATLPAAGDALAAARALADALAPMSLRIRAAIHVGEVELRSDGDIGGLNVHVAARLLALDTKSDIVLSGPAAGAVPEDTLYFGDAELKGLPGRWAVHTTDTR